MELAIIAFRQILTMVMLMILGVICFKLKIIDEETNKKLSNFLLMIITPAVIFMSYQRSFEEELLTGLFISLGLASFSFLLSILISHLVYKDKKGKSFEIERFSCVYSNCGFIGIPLIQGVFGSEGVFYLTAYLTVFNLLLWTHGIITMSGDRGVFSFKKALISPAILSTIFGFLFFILRIEIPSFFSNPILLIGDMNTPLAMIVAGISISKANIGRILKDVNVYKICFMRLLIIPSLIIIAFSFLPFSRILTGTSIVAASCPIGASLILFSYRYEKDYLYAAELFAATTIFSMITIPFLMIFI